MTSSGGHVNAEGREVDEDGFTVFDEDLCLAGRTGGPLAGPSLCHLPRSHRGVTDHECGPHCGPPIWTWPSQADPPVVDCAVVGHAWEMVYEVGVEDPVLIVCGNCPRQCKVMAGG